jgi:hypothetical protein
VHIERRQNWSTTAANGPDEAVSGDITTTPTGSPGSRENTSLPRASHAEVGNSQRTEDGKDHLFASVASHK